MEFESATPSIVRAIKQRDLLNTWLRLFARDERVPAREDFRPNRIEDELPDMVFLCVEYGAPEPRFIIESDGEGPADALGSRGAGRYLDEYLGTTLAVQTVPVYRACVARGLPAYTISVVDDVNGRAVDYERLLLPFSADGERVETIIASLKTISESGGFQNRNLLRGHTKPPTFKLGAIIDRDLIHRMPGRFAPGDVIEI
jgi:hypothetical protein